MFPNSATARARTRTRSTTAPINEATTNNAEDDDNDSLDKGKLHDILSVIAKEENMPQLMMPPSSEGASDVNMQGLLGPDNDEEPILDSLARCRTTSDTEPSSSSSSSPTSQDLRCVTGVATRTGALNQEVAQLVGCTCQEALELIQLGAVWARMEPMTEEMALDQYYDPSKENSAQYADLPRGWGAGSSHFAGKRVPKSEGGDLDHYVEKMSKQRYRRILTSMVVEAGTDLRVYPSPRRFPACYELTRERLLYEDTTFIIVDKPPMLPTQPDTSNYQECCPGCVNDLMGPFTTISGERVHRPLLCHRVDNVVGGCVVLSKDRNGQKVFHDFQRQRKLKKIYLAVTQKPVPLGRHIHWMWAPQLDRGKSGGPPCQLISHETPETRKKAKQFWIRCVLEVARCDPIRVESNEFYQAGEEANDDGQPQHYQSTIRLVTGRKHQVRAQLASLGAPIIGDTLYEPMSGLTLDKLENSEVTMDDAIAQCKVPTQPIGLQAHGVLFGSIRVKARTPWWGDDILEVNATEGQ